MRKFSGKSVAMTVAAGLSLLVGLGAENPVANKKKFYADDPIWNSPKPVAAHTAARKLDDYYDFLSNTFFPAGERAPHTGIYLPSQGVNTVDEVPDSAWYTNRHASRPMSEAELKAGATQGRPPAPEMWTVVAAKRVVVSRSPAREHPWRQAWSARQQARNGAAGIA